MNFKTILWIIFSLLTNSEYNFLKKGQRFAKIYKTFTKTYLGEAETGLNGVADEGTGKEKVLIFWISLRLTFSSNPKWTAKFFRLVNKLSSETERFDLSSKYLRAFFTMAARLAFAFSLTCSILSASDSGICKSTKKVVGTYAKKTRLAIFSVILIHFLIFLLFDRPNYFELVIV